MIPHSPEHRTPGEAMAAEALALSWGALRIELTVLLESTAMATLHEPPDRTRMTVLEQDTARQQITALRAISKAHPDLPGDDQPEWLNAVIEGRIEI